MDSLCRAAHGANGMANINNVLTLIPARLQGVWRSFGSLKQVLTFGVLNSHYQRMWQSLH